MDKSSYPFVAIVTIASGNKTHNDEVIESVVLTELEYVSLQNLYNSKSNNGKVIITYRPAKWKDLHKINFFLRVWYSLPKWAIAVGASAITFSLSNWKEILLWAKQLSQLWQKPG